jgi:hypothetical protein
VGLLKSWATRIHLRAEWFVRISAEEKRNETDPSAIPPLERKETHTPQRSTKRNMDNLQYYLEWQILGLRTIRVRRLSMSRSAVTAIN